MRERIAALTPDEKRLMGVMASSGCIFDPIFEDARSVFIFNATEEEPMTRPIIRAALMNGKEVYLPRIEGDVMVCVPYREGDALAMNEYGISEPIAEALPFEKALALDLAIVPLVAFDKDKHRLGRGKGYYDRFLKRFSGVSLGYAFSVQECDSVPIEPHDVTLDYIFTEEGCVL